jgi:hypothetical protein
MSLRSPRRVVQMVSSLLALPLAMAACTGNPRAGDGGIPSNDASRGQEATGTSNDEGGAASDTDGSTGGETTTDAPIDGPSKDVVNDATQTPNDAPGADVSTMDDGAVDSASADDGVADAQDAAPFTAVLANPGFESGLWVVGTHYTTPSWTIEGDTDASYGEWGGRTGTLKLTHWKATAFTVTTHQIVSPIPNGTYTFAIWVLRAPNFVKQYIFARSRSDDANDQLTMDTYAPDASTWTQVALSGITVNNHQCDVGIYSEAAQGNVWANFDDATLTLNP